MRSRRGDIRGGEGVGDGVAVGALHGIDTDGGRELLVVVVCTCGNSGGSGDGGVTS